MNVILDDVVQILFSGLLPFLRISALMLAAPLVSLEVVNIRIRLSISILLTIFSGRPRQFLILIMSSSILPGTLIILSSLAL